MGLQMKLTTSDSSELHGLQYNTYNNDSLVLAVYWVLCDI